MKLNKDQELVCGINAANEIISIRPDSVSKLFIEEDKGRRIERGEKEPKVKEKARYYNFPNTVAYGIPI